MADERGSPHNQSMEDPNDELLNENVEHLIEEDYSEEDEYAHGGEDEIESEEEDEDYGEEDEYAHGGGDEDGIESEEEEEMMNEDSENGAETASLSGCEEDEYEEGMNGYDIDGLHCPICLDTWTNGGEHQVCCLPCGHICGLSCIKTWIQRHESSRKCPQCKKNCSLQDIRVLYASRIVAVDEKLQKKVKWLEAKCASMKKKQKVKEAIEGMMAAEQEAMKGRMAELEAAVTKLREEAERYRAENNACMRVVDMFMAAQTGSKPQSPRSPPHTAP